MSVVFAFMEETTSEKYPGGLTDTIVQSLALLSKQRFSSVLKIEGDLASARGLLPTAVLILE